MITRLLDWLDRSLYVSIPAAPVEEDWSHYYNVKVNQKKEALGTRYILHKSNHVKRLDGKQYGSPAPGVKLRKV